MAIVTRRNKNGSVSFQVKVKDHEGKWFPTPKFSLLDLAKGEEARLMGLKRKGAKAISDDAKTVTVDEFWEVWSVENRIDVSAGWKKSQDQMYRDYVKSAIGNRTMINVQAPEIGRLMNEAKDKGLGEQTRKHVYSLLRKMFNDAVEYYEMITVSPVKAKFHRPKVKMKKRSFLMPAEAFRLLDFTKDHYLGPAIWMQILAGLRPGEAQAVKGKSLLFDLNQILICATYNKKVKVLQDFPKQEDWAYSPMPPMLKAYLLKLNIGPNEFVAKSASGQMLSYDTYIKALKTLCKAIGVTPITPHELRHTSSEIYVQSGASAEDIRRLLNHSDLSATKHYMHRTDERLNAIASVVGSNTLRLVTVQDNFPNSFPNGKKEPSASPGLEEADAQ